jgi:hypothetical protein
MKTKNTIILVLVLAAIAFGLSYFKHPELSHQDQTSEPIVETPATHALVSFAWSYEQASSLNPDGNPNTNIFLEATYKGGIFERKLIDTTGGSCNALPDTDADSLPNTQNIQCYGAGFGDRFKITKGPQSYLVNKMSFEEGSPDYVAPSTPYEVIAEFPLTK